MYLCTVEEFNPVMPSIHKIVKHTLNTIAARFKHVFDHFVKTRHEIHEIHVIQV